MCPSDAASSGVQESEVTRCLESLNWADCMDEEDARVAALMGPAPGHWAHNPYGNGLGLAAEAAQVPLLLSVPENAILEEIIRVMEDPQINRYRGSVPVEKVQNVVSTRLPWLLRVALQRRTFNHFIACHPELFEIFAVDTTKKRMRYLPHKDWEAADRLTRSERHAQNNHIEQALVAFLVSKADRACDVDEFIAAYPALWCNARPDGAALQHALPKRGDLVRMVRHRVHLFQFQDEAHRIQLLPQVVAPRRALARHVAGRV